MHCDALQFRTCKREDAIMKVEKRPSWHLGRSTCFFLNVFFSNSDMFNTIFEYKEIWVSIALGARQLLWNFAHRRRRDG